MTNTQTGEVTFNTKGMRYTLRFSTNALCRLEDVTGQGAMALAQAMNDPAQVRLTGLRAMMWAGLTDHHSDITIEQAGQLMDALGMDQAGPLIGQALSAAFPAQDDAAAGAGAPGKG